VKGGIGGGRVRKGVVDDQTAGQMEERRVLKEWWGAAARYSDVSAMIYRYSPVDTETFLAFKR
jgi:hypothetical protein